MDFLLRREWTDGGLNKSFLLGAVLSGPFVEAVIPVPGISFLFAFIYLVYSFLTGGLQQQLVFLRLKKSFLFVLLILIHCFAFFFTSGAFPNGYWIFYFTFLYSVYLWSPNRVEGDTVLKGVAFVLVPLALLFSGVAFLKLVLIERGMLLAPFYFVYKNAVWGQPWGSSLRSDYNVFSMGLLVAAYFILSGYWLKNRIINWCSLLLLVIVVFYSGSRRGFLYLFSIPIVFIISEVIKGKMRLSVCLKQCVYFASLGVLVYLSTSIILTDIRHDHYRIWPDFTGVGRVQLAHVYTVVPMRLESSHADNVQDFTSSSERPFTSSSERPFTSSERINRWSYAIDLLAEQGFLAPGGYEYQAKFGCRFYKCSEPDYPHNLILSEWLVGGIFGLLVLFGCVVFFLAQMKFLLGFSFGVDLACVAFLVMPSLLISGDYLFCSSMAVIVLLLAKMLYESYQKIEDIF
ncbi:O-antigen ligase family protein [Bdellovibrio bacteriovorus]|uniref:O-antigen ligase family protein n=1 Tax=Bdellovibrio bacteriovorus TaxID=959 RepID=UPI0035A6B745